MILIQQEKPSHWYLPDGTSFHTVAAKSGEMRPVTLRDARKVGAFPSVTNILNVIAKPGLESWKQEQAILSALTLPRLDNEPLDVFAKRVVTDMEQGTKQAADLGSSVHAAAEAYLLHETLPENPDVAELFEPLKEWIDGNIISVECVERTVSSKSHAYAGRVDLIAEVQSHGKAILDIKTQRVDAKAPWKPRLYDTWPLQLEAYRRGYAEGEFHEPKALLSVVVCSTRPEPVHVENWEDHQAYWDAFTAAIKLWQYVKGYNPLNS